MKTIYTDLYADWLENIKPPVVDQYGEDDEVALSESWNDWTDGEFKDRRTPDLIQHHCPSHDDEMPEDAGAYILEQMGVIFEVYQIDERPDPAGAGWPDDASHWQVTVRRNVDGDEMKFYFSMGSACATPPDPAEALWSVLMDTGVIGYTDPEEVADIMDPGSAFSREFDHWCSDAGRDQDIEALRVFGYCVELRRDLDNLFTEDEQDQLREILEY